MNSTVPAHIIIKARELKAGDIIIHNYSRFKINNCGFGYVAGNEFGDYFWIKGYSVNGNKTDPNSIKDFLAFEECPVIKLI